MYKYTQVKLCTVPVLYIYSILYYSIDMNKERGATVAVKRDIHRLLKIRAAQEGLSISELIKKLLKIKNEAVTSAKNS